MTMIVIKWSPLTSARGNEPRAHKYASPGTTACGRNWNGYTGTWINERHLRKLGWGKCKRCFP